MVYHVWRCFYWGEKLSGKRFRVSLLNVLILPQMMKSSSTRWDHSILFWMASFFYVFFLKGISVLFLSVQGRCVLTVQLTEEEVAADDGHMDYFLLFVGSTQRHLTSTLRSNHDTLQALCPGKPVCPQHFVTSLLPTMSLRGPCK